jgi:hypothetical protein
MVLGTSYTIMTYEILLLPHHLEEARIYVEKYKTFRLLALQTSPECFGSTYSREVEFTDDIWLGRLTNPVATTFVAVQSDRFASTLTVMGPLTYSPEELSPSANPWEVIEGMPQSPSHYRLGGMFTLPETRGHGIAKALIAKAVEHMSAQSKASRKEFVASLAVGKENDPARSLYEKCGFCILKEEIFQQQHGRVLEVLLLAYTGPKVVP